MGLLQTACHHASLGHYLEKHCLSRVTLLCHGWLGQDPKTKEILRYEGWDASLAFIKDYIALHGPFDGFWAFSQAREVREQGAHYYNMYLPWAMCGVIAAVLISVGSAGHNSRISSSCDEAARAHPAGVQTISRWPATWMPIIQIFEYTVARIDRYRLCGAASMRATVCSLLWRSHCCPFHAASLSRQQDSGPLCPLRRRQRLCQKGNHGPWLRSLVPVQSHPPFKCIVCIAGIRPGASRADVLLAKKLPTPSLHIIGKKDYVNEVAKDFACLCACSSMCVGEACKPVN